MPLIEQQDVIVVGGPYLRNEDPVAAAAAKLKSALKSYPPCRIIAISGYGTLAGYKLTAVVESV